MTISLSYKITPAELHTIWPFKLLYAATKLYSSSLFFTVVVKSTLIDLEYNAPSKNQPSQWYPLGFSSGLQVVKLNVNSSPTLPVFVSDYGDV